MEVSIQEQRSALVVLTKGDPDPGVRHRAHVRIAALDAPTRRAAASDCGVSGSSIKRWAARFVVGGRDGLADRLRPGRPAKLSDAARELLRTALTQTPEVYGYPVTVWAIADLTDLLAQHGWNVSAATVSRTVHAMGQVYRRPRHDLRHRQDAEAVASAANTLAVLQKKGLIAPADSVSGISTSANFTPIPTWCVVGDHAVNQPASQPPEPMNGSPSSGPWRTAPAC